MSTTVKRGYSPNDQKEFGGKSIDILLKAGRDLQYLLNQGYNIKSASTFVGNHYLLSERQRLALVRAISSEENIKMRKNKEIIGLLSSFDFEVQVEVINNVDAILEKLDNVITSDAIILDKCVSWINLNAKIIEEVNADYPYIDFN